MPYVLHLADSLYECPDHWINFVKAHNPDGQTVYHMHSVLKNEYRAKIDNSVSQVVFDKEADYVMFKLRWS